MKENLFPSRIIQFIGVLFASVVLATPFTFLVGIDSFTTNDIYQTIFYTLVCSLIIGICYWINYHRKQRLSWDYKPVNIRLLYLMFILLFIFSIGINKPVNNIIEQILQTEREISNNFNRLYLVIGAVIIAPILEEIIFRGILLKGLLTRYSPKYSIILSALIFGLIHGKPLQIWGAFIIGLILGWIFLKTQSIGTTIVLHFFLNITTLINSYFLHKYHSLSSMIFLNIFLFLISIPLIYYVARQLIFKLNTNINDKIANCIR